MRLHQPRSPWSWLWLAALLPLFHIGCESEEVAAPVTNRGADIDGMSSVDPQSLALSIAELAGWPLEEDAQSLMVSELGALGPGVAADPQRNGHLPVHRVEREVIAGDIVHYEFVIPTGFGPFHEVRLHRVVRERRPYHPIRTEKNVFMVHGDGAPFRAAFLSSTLSAGIPDDRALPVYLAASDVDVWGIDLGWTLVPEGVPDLSFMADWGLQREIDDIQVGLAVARFTRLVTGSGFGKFNLLGWSRGVWLGFAYLDMETQLHPRFRHVRGFIPVDGYVKTDQEGARQFTCDNVVTYQGYLESGIYADETGVLVHILADLARTAPEDPSPVFEGLTNMQAALFLGAVSYTFPALYTPWYHIVAGDLDENGIPTGLRYTQVEHWLDFLSGWAPYQPARVYVETEQISCDEIDSPFDDHLGEIEVPIFLLGAGGGLGPYGLYSLTLVGSDDVTSLVVSLDSDPFVDLGHADIFLSDGAEPLTWAPVRDWLETH